MVIKWKIRNFGKIMSFITMQNVKHYLLLKTRVVRKWSLSRFRENKDVGNLGLQKRKQKPKNALSCGSGRQKKIFLIKRFDKQCQNFLIKKNHLFFLWFLREKIVIFWIFFKCLFFVEVIFSASIPACFSWKRKN